MLNVVLQVAVGGARGVAHPRWDKDSDGDQAVGMDVEETEDLRLGKTEGMPDGAGFERGILRQLDDELHAQRPLAAGVTLGQAEFFVQSVAHRAHRTIAHHGQ